MIKYDYIIRLNSYYQGPMMIPYYGAFPSAIKAAQNALVKHDYDHAEIWWAESLKYVAVVNHPKP